jgi:hypothetical protein
MPLKLILKCANLLTFAGLLFKLYAGAGLIHVLKKLGAFFVCKTNRQYSTCMVFLQGY